MLHVFAGGYIPLSMVNLLFKDVGIVHPAAGPRVPAFNRA
jgi:hypothetical protein